MREDLPARQRQALDVVLLQTDVEGRADARATAMAFLAVLGALAADRPVAVAVDDVQWLDRASERALEFAARRLPARIGFDIARMLARGGQELAPAAYSGQPPGYGQGLRLIDASDARNLRQVGYYDVTGTDPATNPSSLSWDVALRGDLIYLFELSGGIEILRLAGGPTASARLPTVREPAGRSDPLAARPVAGLTRGSLVCPVS